MSNALGVNLRRYRKKQGTTQGDLASRADLSRVAYRNIETVKSEPKESTVRALAKALGISVMELLRPAPEMPNVRFRSQQTLSAQEMAEREQIVVETGMWLRDFCALEDLLDDRTPFRYADYRRGNKRPRTVAEEIREEMDFACEQCIPNVSDALEDMGVKVRFIESTMKKLFGLSVSDDECGGAVVINRAGDVPVERQIFTAAHEFGHLLLHASSYLADELEEDRKQEDEANEFASYFLMPKADFLRVWNENRGLHWIDNILNTKRRFRVSYKTVIRRLIDEGVTDRTLYRKFAVAYRRRTGRTLKFKDEPQPLTKSEEPCRLDPCDFIEDKLGRLVRDALQDNKITLSRAAEVLDLSIEEMRRGVASWEMFE